ncbi:MAG TPA: homocysteine S-methyltransferase family protein [Nocardioidaceae bacterium]|nr:homocysteine S-methyltransferase family protein [Nocardioidaceae bacterium]
MADLPQLADSIFLTDGGIETTLIYQDGFDLPEFAAFVLLDTEDGRAALRRYFESYVAVAKDAGVGIVLETPTWRASNGWGAKLGYSADAVATVNRAAVDQLLAIREEQETASTPIIVSGCVGPQRDGYHPSEWSTPEGAEAYHAAQIQTFADAGADLVTAITMTHTGEAIGFVRAATAAGLPSVISFTVETDGRLPSGETLGEAVQKVDAETDGPAYFMVNCAHPTHLADTLLAGDGWQDRVRGLRSNASTMSHDELDVAEELDRGDPADLGARYAALRKELPKLTVLGGCCGTDAGHIRAISDACLA